MAEFNFASAREIHHFFHSHILELTTFRGQGAIENYCRGCMRPIGEGLAYHCQPCNFLLHLTCSQIPQQITHPACGHVLHLLSQPWNYAPSACRCNACWQPITHGFSFHCSICWLDLHPSCANLPREINHPHHQRHNLFLLFIPPYQNRLFTCNVCHGVGGSWHYHCSECNYDSHVNCTQIPSIRESLLNEASEAVSRAYVNNGGGHMGGYMSTRSGPSHMEGGFWEQQQRPPLQDPYINYGGHMGGYMSTRSGPGHLERGFWEHQQRPPFQDPYNNTRGNMFVRPVIGTIMHTVLGSILQAFMNPGGGGNGWGLDSFGDLSDVIGSLFGYGFY